MKKGYRTYKYFLTVAADASYKGDRYVELKLLTLVGVLVGGGGGLGVH